MTSRAQSTPEFFDGQVVKCAHIPGMSIGEIHYPPAFQRRRHTHERACFHFLFKGGYVEYMGRRSWECKTLTLVFQPRGHEHSYCGSIEPSKTLTIELEHAWLANLRDYSVNLDRPVNFQGGSVSWLTAKLYRELYLMESASTLAIEALAVELAVEAARHTERPSGPTGPRWLKQARDLIHDHFAESLTLHDVAQSVGVHPVHLARVFRRHYGSTVGEYLRHLRIEYAGQQIIHSRSTLVDIAQAAGFSDQSQFSKTFKRATGLTPAQFRAQAQLR
jgi:AraC family transcriptional regulator